MCFVNKNYFFIFYLVLLLTLLVNSNPPNDSESNHVNQLKVYPSQILATSLNRTQTSFNTTDGNEIDAQDQNEISPTPLSLEGDEGSGGDSDSSSPEEHGLIEPSRVNMKATMTVTATRIGMTRYFSPGLTTLQPDSTLETIPSSSPSLRLENFHATPSSTPATATMTTLETERYEPSTESEVVEEEIPEESKEERDEQEEDLGLLESPVSSPSTASLKNFTTPTQSSPSVDEDVDDRRRLSETEERTLNMHKENFLDDKPSSSKSNSRNEVQVEKRVKSEWDMLDPIAEQERMEAEEDLEQEQQEQLPQPIPLVSPSANSIPNEEDQLEADFAEAFSNKEGQNKRRRRLRNGPVRRRVRKMRVRKVNDTFPYNFFPRPLGEEDETGQGQTLNSFNVHHHQNNYPDTQSRHASRHSSSDNSKFNNNNSSRRIPTRPRILRRFRSTTTTTSTPIDIDFHSPFTTELAITEVPPPNFDYDRTELAINSNSKSRQSSNRPILLKSQIINYKDDRGNPGFVITAEPDEEQIERPTFTQKIRHEDENDEREGDGEDEQNLEDNLVPYNEGSEKQEVSLTSPSPITQLNDGKETPKKIVASTSKIHNNETGEWLHSEHSKQHDVSHDHEGEDRNQWEQNYMNLQQHSFVNPSSEDENEETTLQQHDGEDEGVGSIRNNSSANNRRGLINHHMDPHVQIIEHHHIVPQPSHSNEEFYGDHKLPHNMFSSLPPPGSVESSLHPTSIHGGGREYFGNSENPFHGPSPGSSGQAFNPYLNSPDASHPYEPSLGGRRAPKKSLTHYDRTTQKYVVHPHPSSKEYPSHKPIMSHPHSSDGGHGPLESPTIEFHEGDHSGSNQNPQIQTKLGPQTAFPSPMKYYTRPNVGPMTETNSIPGSSESYSFNAGNGNGGSPSDMIHQKGLHSPFETHFNSMRNSIMKSSSGSGAGSGAGVGGSGGPSSSPTFSAPPPQSYAHFSSNGPGKLTHNNFKGPSRTPPPPHSPSASSSSGNSFMDFPFPANSVQDKLNGKDTMGPTWSPQIPPSASSPFDYSVTSHGPVFPPFNDGKNLHTRLPPYAHPPSGPGGQSPVKSADFSNSHASILPSYHDHHHSHPPPSLTLPMPGLVNIPTPPPASMAMNEVTPNRHFPPHSHSMASQSEYEPANPPLPSGHAHALDQHFDHFVQNAGRFNTPQHSESSHGHSKVTEVEQYREVGTSPTYRQEPSPYRPTRPPSHSKNRYRKYKFLSTPNNDDPEEQGDYRDKDFYDGHSISPSGRPSSHSPFSYHHDHNELTDHELTNLNHPGPDYHPDENGHTREPFEYDHRPEHHDHHDHHENDHRDDHLDNKPEHHHHEDDHHHTTDYENVLKTLAHFNKLNEGNDDKIKIENEEQEVVEKNHFSETPYVIMFPNMIRKSPVQPPLPPLPPSVPLALQQLHGDRHSPAGSASEQSINSPDKFDKYLGPGLKTVVVHPRHQMMKALATKQYLRKLEEFQKEQNKPPTAIYTPYGILVPMGPSSSASTNAHTFIPHKHKLSSSHSLYSPHHHHSEGEHTILGGLGYKEKGDGHHHLLHIPSDEKGVLNLLLGAKLPQLGHIDVHKKTKVKGGKILQQIGFKASVEPALDLLAEKLAIKLNTLEYLISHRPKSLGFSLNPAPHSHSQYTKGYEGSYSELKPVKAPSPITSSGQNKSNNTTTSSTSKASTLTFSNGKVSSTSMNPVKHHSTVSTSATGTVVKDEKGESTKVSSPPPYSPHLKSLLKERLAEMLVESVQDQLVEYDKDGMMVDSTKMSPVGIGVTTKTSPSTPKPFPSTEPHPFSRKENSPRFPYDRAPYLSLLKKLKLGSFSFPNRLTTIPSRTTPSINQNSRQENSGQQLKRPQPQNGFFNAIKRLFSFGGGGGKSDNFRSNNNNNSTGDNAMSRKGRGNLDKRPMKQMPPFKSTKNEQKKANSTTETSQHSSSSSSSSFHPYKSTLEIEKMFQLLLKSKPSLFMGNGNGNGERGEMKGLFDKLKQHQANSLSLLPLSLSSASSSQQDDQHNKHKKNPQRFHFSPTSHDDSKWLPHQTFSFPNDLSSSYSHSEPMTINVIPSPKFVSPSTFMPIPSSTAPSSSSSSSSTLSTSPATSSSSSSSPTQISKRTDNEFALNPTGAAFTIPESLLPIPTAWKPIPSTAFSFIRPFSPIPMSPTKAPTSSLETKIGEDSHSQSRLTPLPVEHQHQQLEALTAALEQLHHKIRPRSV